MVKKLNLGCGNDVREEWDNADIQEGKGIISFNFNVFPYPFEDNTYDYIEVKQVLNFLDVPDKVLYELWRIAKHKAIIKIIVPYWHNKGAYNDIQGKHWFNENAFINFIEQKPCRINTQKKFDLIYLDKTPTIIGRFMPRWFRETLDLFMSGLIANIELEMVVSKKQEKFGRE